MATASSPPERLIALLKETPSLPYFLPDSPQYAEYLRHYTSTATRPPVILRPQTEQHVAAAVAACAAAVTPFTVRAGGHDLCGRSLAPGAACIDVRGVAYVRVAADRATARVGGGVLLKQLLAELDAEGLMTAAGTVGTVGFAGWSTLGGYGPFLGSFGLGMDQIVGARVVTARGLVEEADEALLEGIRGGAGNFGVITELTVKVYPVQDVQNGFLVVDSSDVVKSVTSFFTNFSALLREHPLPGRTYVQPCVFEIPGQGKSFMVSYSWLGSAGPEEEAWRQKVAACGPVVASTVKATRAARLIDEMTAAVAASTHVGRTATVSLAPLGLGADAIARLAECAAALPAGGAGLSLHMLHGQATRPSLPAVFRNRREHWMVEFIGLSAAPEAAAASAEWAVASRRRIKDVEEVQEGTYFSLTWKDDIDLAKIYGDEGLETLRALKKEKDPENVFRYAVPQL